MRTPLLVVALLAWPAPVTVAAPSTADVPVAEAKLRNPMAEQRTALRRQALEQVLHGPAAAGTSRRTIPKTVRVGMTAQQSDALTQTTFAETTMQDVDQVFVLLVDFGDRRHQDYPDRDTSPLFAGPQKFAGPAANDIPKPNRLVDNTTIWQNDYDRAYYERLYFDRTQGQDSLANYLTTQSAGRYSIEGYVSPWTKVPYNQARYGRSNGYPCAGNICTNMWALIDDGMQAWYDAEVAAGRTPAQIKEFLTRFDRWDRYDIDGDGNFDEPDGYVDHLQVVHAGADQATLDARYGEDAVWSHRWYSHVDQLGLIGPPGAPLGGAPVADTGIWTADYTVQSENGGLGTFAHEYLHDLGLPDLYDTSGLGEGPVGYWSVMAAGNYLGPGRESIGTRPGNLSAWDRLQLGWIDFDVVYEQEQATHELGPLADAGGRSEAVVAILPERKRTHRLGVPPQGERAWWAGLHHEAGRSTMLTIVDLPFEGPLTLEFSAWYQSEKGYDQAFVEVNDGTGWKVLSGSIGDPGTGAIDGDSKGWKQAKYDLGPYAGSLAFLRFRYVSDATIMSKGFMADSIKVTAAGTQVFFDGAEAEQNPWSVSGFSRSTGQEDTYHPGYYVAEYRAYNGWDAGLRTGPYNHGFQGTRPKWVEHFPYQDGLLVWYWDTSTTDNNVGTHPCEGQVLPVDAHPQVLRFGTAGPWRSKVQVYDATFGLQPTDPITLHHLSVEQRIPSAPAAPVFDDRAQHCDPGFRDSGVTLPATGTTLRVVEQTPEKLVVRAN